MSHAEESELQPDFQPEPVMRIGNPETLRAIGDPTRVRMLETMVQRLDPAWSVKELAVALGVPQTRLYHHVELLLTHGLIRAVERRVVSGIIETRYRVGALSFQLDRRMFEGEDAPREILHDTLIAVFDTARDEVEAAIASGVIGKGPGASEDRLLVTKGLARLTPVRAAELHRRLRALEAEFGNDDPTEGDEPWGFVLAIYPAATPTTPPEEPTDG